MIASRRFTTVALHIVTLLVVARAAPARAQSANVNAQQFQPAATSGGIIGLDTAFVAPHLHVAGSLFLDYAYKPVVVLDFASDKKRTIIGSALDADLALSLGLWNRLEVGVLLPVLFYQTANSGLIPTAHDLDHTAVGDLRLEVKLRLFTLQFTPRSAFAVGLVAGLGLPTGNRNAFYAQDGVTFTPRLVGSLRLSRFELDVQVGAVIRGDRDIDNLNIGQQLSYGIGARVRVVAGLALVGTYSGLAALSGNDGTSGAPMEFLVGPEYRFCKLPFELFVAAGRGFTDALGSPDARVVGALRYQPRPPVDRDGDGVPDAQDACPRDPGPASNRGCPILAPPPPVDKDADGDGLIDRLDKCPHEAGPKENDGCPDKDSDNDGTIDRLDKCPTVAGPAENAGCPWPDTDGDGLVDKDDACPSEAGPLANKGCPDKDSDGDGIVDRLDKCPNEKETFNGFEDDDGCPDKGPELAVLTATGIDIHEQVYFEVGRDEIKPRSFALLAVVAKILKLHPELAHVRIEGHTDNSGRRDKNLKLSKARAEAVKQHLVTVDGVDAARLSAEGFGPDRPIADNRTAAGRAKNRRSEFVITP